MIRSWHGFLRSCKDEPGVNLLLQGLTKNQLSKPSETRRALRRKSWGADVRSKVDELRDRFFKGGGKFLENDHEWGSWKPLGNGGFMKRAHLGQSS